jgi:carbonic anhydrase
MINAQEALERLKEGNRRFVANQHSASPFINKADAQEPFAIILGCSDSRVPAEIVFDQGLGDLFVIRVAGNIVAPSQVGSVEFAAARFGTRLVVVLGHTGCGAIAATLDALADPAGLESQNIKAIVDRVSPSVEGLMKTELRDDMDELAKVAVRVNIRASVYHLRHGSPLLERLIQEGGLQVVGAEYHLETGTVEFLEDVPASSPSPSRNAASRP